MQADYFTRHSVINDEEIKLLKSIAEPYRHKAGVGGSNKEKTWRNKITDKLKRSSTVFWFRQNEHLDADAIIIKAVNHLIDISYNYYGQEINTIEPVQYTKYGILNHYGWHMDSPHQIDEGQTSRLISASVELDDPKSYGYGGLDFRDHPNPRPNVRKGTITCFPSLMIHRARPVLWGTRSSLVLWGGFRRDQEAPNEQSK
jgi:predicted 2-oxoglutarate/Fe(II)-dependent dioxygenase YbiX